MVTSKMQAIWQLLLFIDVTFLPFLYTGTATNNCLRSYYISQQRYLLLGIQSQQFGKIVSDCLMSNISFWWRESSD